MSDTPDTRDPAVEGAFGFVLATHHGMADTSTVRDRMITLETAAKCTPNRQRWLSFSWRVVD